MGYRKRTDHERSKAWKTWIAENRARLERIGLPLAIYQDAAHWDDFLANGHLHWHSDGPPFDFLDLSRAQMKDLCDVLERDQLDEAPPLLRWLRVRLSDSDQR